MITREELNPKGYKLTDIQAKNFEVLYFRINELRKIYDHPMIVTSGVRSSFDQDRINPKAKNSCHVQAAAVDISDPDGNLWGWLMDNLELLAEIGLWLEDRSATPRWVHFQVLPPKSGNRIFLP